MTETCTSTRDVRLARQVRLGDRRARVVFVERYLPFARAIAAGYRHGTEPLDDLIQVASLGLVKAVDRWDPDRGVPFFAFARPTIRGELRRHFRDTAWMVRPPRPLQELSAAIEAAREPLTASQRRAPTVADFADSLGRSPRDIEEGQLVQERRWPRPLEAPTHAGRGDAPPIADACGDVDGAYALTELRATVDAVVSTMPLRVRQIVWLRFEVDLTQAEIGRIVGCSQMQVSRTLRSAFREIGGSAGPVLDGIGAGASWARAGSRRGDLDEEGVTRSLSAR